MTQEELLERIAKAKRDGETFLKLCGEGLRELPPEIGQLTNLKTLDLTHNQLTALPPEISLLSKLETLHLTENQLTALPPELFQLTQLTELSLWGNQLTALPPEIILLSKLETLHLADNQLSTLPPEISQLTQLTKLRLDHNQLTALPPEIGQLTNLTELILWDNELTALPPETGQLTQLTKLDLGGNQLTALPPEISLLSKLEKLSLAGNQLTALPPEIGQLTQLTELYHHLNRLTALPPEIRQLTNLKELYLHDNPELDIPPEILGPTLRDVRNNEAKPASPQEILNFYFRMRADEKRRPLNEAKVILVGQGSVGKTSLVNRIVYNTFNPQEEKTDRINIDKNWSVAGQSDDRVQINFWDFGGQEIMHATHQFFLTRRTVYLLVLDARKGENESNIYYWLKMIRSFGGDAPIIIVMNKCESHYHELNRNRLQKDYPNIRGFVETCCESGKGVEKLKKAIETEIHSQEMKHVFNFLPESYFTVKKELEALAEKKDHIDISEYYGLCERHGLPEKREQTTLLRFLHDLGSVLNFDNPDDPYELREKNVLNPEWVTVGVYKILNDVETAKRGGRLDRKDLHRILDPDTHPSECHDFIIEMMRKFELCFDVTRRKSWLVPELLHVNEPSLDWPYSESLNFQYHYEILPAGIICRFITRRDKDLTKSPTYWRSGVILKLDGCRALVRSDKDKGVMFISVQGPEPRRRSALAVIRDEFHKIHNTIPELKPKEMVPLPDDLDIQVGYKHLLFLEEQGDQDFTPQDARRKYSVTELLDGVAEPARRIEDRRMMEFEEERLRRDDIKERRDEPEPRKKEPDLKWPVIALGGAAAATGWLWLIWRVPNLEAKVFMAIAAVIFVFLLKRNPQRWYRIQAGTYSLAAIGSVLWTFAPNAIGGFFKEGGAVAAFIMENAPSGLPGVFFVFAACFFGLLDLLQRRRG